MLFGVGADLEVQIFFFERGGGGGVGPIESFVSQQATLTERRSRISFQPITNGANGVLARCSKPAKPENRQTRT